MQLYFLGTKLPNLKLKTQPKQLLGYRISYRAPWLNLFAVFKDTFFSIKQVFHCEFTSLALEIVIPFQWCPL